MNFNLLLEKAKAAGITEIEIYSQHKQGLNINLFDSKIEKYVISNTQGLAVRGIYNDKMGYVSVENVSDDKIDFIINKLIDNAKALTNNETSFIYEGSKSYPEIINESKDFFGIDPQVKLNP